MWLAQTGTMVYLWFASGPAEAELIQPKQRGGVSRDEKVR